MRLLTIQPKKQKQSTGQVAIIQNHCWDERVHNKTNHRYPHQTSQIKYRVGLTIKHPCRPILHILHINCAEALQQFGRLW